MADRLFLWDEKNGMDLSNAIIASAGGSRDSTETWLTVLTGHHGARCVPYPSPSAMEQSGFWTAKQDV
ncbi:hypothetical protein AYO43_07145 [Nitrospira sp. SCGC AG-212-E16]|nr:hypothetical protein AYO43_07145 [Nitrospira sp. SCGC AG-212-E16]